MFRLLAILGVVMFLGLLIGGQDRGQVRQGLMAPPPEPVRAAAPLQPAAETGVVLTTYVPVAAPAIASPAPSTVVTAPEPAAAVAAPEAPAEAALPVFSLSTLPEAEPAATPPDTALPLRYVLAKSVNVRQGPSTNDPVIGRLARAEAVSVVGDAGDGWLLVRIEGDGIEGFVAARLLTDTPVN